jgi:lactoylglutathione lyase
VLPRWEVTVFMKSSRAAPVLFWRSARVPSHATHVSPSPRLVGINHVALEVGDLEEALTFYGRIFDFELRGQAPRMAFLDMGDQFLALSEGRRQQPDEGRHFGLVVDDKAETRRALEEAGVEILPGRGLDFLDPWGNRVEVVDYRDIQFTKTASVLHGMELEGLGKSEAALDELRRKGLL